MSQAGLDYSTFSLCSALTPSQPVPPSARSYPADPTQQHVAEDVIDAHICNMQRDDLPSSSEMADCPRESALALFGAYRRQGPNSDHQTTFAFPGSPLLSDSVDDIQGNILCAQLGGFHFTPHYRGQGHPSGDELVNVPTTAIMEHPSFPWGASHAVHDPTINGSVSPSISSASVMAEDARPELTLLHCDVNTRPAPRIMVITDRPLGPGPDSGFEFGLLGASSPLTAHMTVDVSPYLHGGAMQSPSPVLTAYQDDDDCGHAFLYEDQQRHLSGRTPVCHYTLDHHDHRCATASSLGYADPSHPGLLPLDHRYANAANNASGMATTPLPGCSPHDHYPLADGVTDTAMHAQRQEEEGEEGEGEGEQAPRPGSAPPLMDCQVPFVGDARAVLQHPVERAGLSSEHATSRPQACWYHYTFPSSASATGVVAPGATGAGGPGGANVGASQSPRSSPRRAGSIGHNPQKTPLGSRHLRRWSSVTNPALRDPPCLFTGSTSSSSSSSTNVVPFPRYHAASSSVIAPSLSASPESNVYAHFSPSTESDGDDSSTAFGLPHAAVDTAESMVCADQPQPQPPLPPPLPPQHSQQPQPYAPTRAVVRCDGHLIDEESWSAALARPDKLLHVYECLWDRSYTPCRMWIEGDQSSVADHLALFHGFRGGEVTTRCLWQACPKPQMKGTSIARHVVTHIGFRVKCATCKHEFARVDACNRAHSRSGCAGVGQPMYGDLQHVIDARKVDPLRPCKKRRTDE